MTQDEIKALRDRANSVLAHPREIQPVAVLEPKQLLALLTIAERAEGLREALTEIAGMHIGDCPAAFGGMTELEWAQRMNGNLRRVARAALVAFGETKP